MDHPADDSNDGDDALARRLFTAAGRRRVPSEALARASEIAFRQALAPVVARRMRAHRRRTIGAAAAAACVIAAAGAVFTMRESAPDPASKETVARIVRSMGPVEVMGPGAVPGATSLQTGQALVTGANGRAALDYRGADVRVNVGSLVRFGPARLVLERGAIYVDAAGTRSAGEPGIVIETRFGTLGDVGTQFFASIEQERLTVAVREGTVFLRSAQDRHDLSATAGSAQVAEVDQNGRFEIHPGATHGGDWAWIPQVSSGFATDGRSVDAYLRWLGDEYGYALDYRSADSATRAKAVKLHGDLSGLSPDEAITAIAAITQLDVAIAAGTITVGSERDHNADPGHNRQ
jgi:hypothetical protein